jgi:starch synthase
LFVTPEVHPWVKTGGLGEVSAGLPPALRKLSIDVRLLMPGYSAVMAAPKSKRPVASIFGFSGLPDSRLYNAHTPGSDVPVWVLRCPFLFERDGGPYLDARGRDWADNHLRFGLLSRVAALLSGAQSPLGWQPDILHCNDWQSGLGPAYVHYSGLPCRSTIWRSRAFSRPMFYRPSVCRPKASA